MIPFHLDSPFSKAALLKLEDVGIQVISTLEKVITEFASIVGIDADKLIEDDSHNSDNTRRRLLWLVMDHWVSQGVPQCYPTWKSLLEMLRKLALEDLCQQIEAHLNISGNSIILP